MNNELPITLRAVEPEDVDIIYQWENAPDQWSESPLHAPISRHALTMYALSAGTEDVFQSRQIRLMALLGSELVGCVDLFDFDPFHHRAAMGLLVAPEHRGQGLGRRIVEVLEDFGRKQMQLHQVYCDIAESNTASLTLFRNLGYTNCGTMKDWVVRENSYENAIRVQKILQ